MEVRIIIGVGVGSRADADFCGKSSRRVHVAEFGAAEPFGMFGLVANSIPLNKVFDISQVVLGINDRASYSFIISCSINFRHLKPRGHSRTYKVCNTCKRVTYSCGISYCLILPGLRSSGVSCVNSEACCFAFYWGQQRVFFWLEVGVVDLQFIAAEPGAAVLLGFTRGHKITSRFGPFDTQVVASITAPASSRSISSLPAQAAASSRSISVLQCTGR